MSQQTTHRIEVLAQYRYNVLQVLWLTCMDEAELERMIMETAACWLMTISNCNDEDFVVSILNEKESRDFWINEWCKRDNRQFLAALYNMPASACKARYKLLHMEQLFNIAHPECIALRNGFARVMNVLADNINDKPCN